MRTAATKRYARWSAIAAVVVAAAVAGLYLRRGWQLRQERQQTPAEVPPSVQQQSAAFSFSKVEGDRTEYTVRASKATVYAGDGRDLLEDVWVTLYGASGQRFDNLRTHACEYMVETGDIHCAGEVQMELQSAEDARIHPVANGRPNEAANIIRVKTSAITFNQKTGNASTDAPVSFRFPRGDGRGVGFRYESERGEVRLLRDVNLVFYPQASNDDLQPSPDSDENLLVHGSSLVYFRDDRRLRLFGPVSAHQESRELSAATAEVEFDSELRARQISALGNPRLQESVSGGSRAIAADKLSASFSVTGWLEGITADGHVHATSGGATHQDRLDSDRAELMFAEASDRPRQLTATGNVHVQSAPSEGGHRSLETSEIVLQFASTGAHGAAQIRHATTPAATVLVQSASVLSGRNVPDEVHLTSRHLEADFGEDGQLSRIDGNGGVEVHRQVENQPLQVATSNDMTAHFDSRGQWSTIDQSGEVRLSQADRSALAQRAHFDHPGDTAALEGAVELLDSRTRTTAKSAILRQSENRLEAEGGVVSSDLSAAESATNLGPGPARVSGDRMVADTATGHAVYSGRARLWQGDTLVQADSVELDRASQGVSALGHVQAILPKSRQSQSGSALQKSSGPQIGDYLHVQARHMDYDGGAGRGLLEGDVRAVSDEGQMRSDVMNLFFAPVEPAGQASVTPSPKPAGSAFGSPMAQRIVRAIASGHVVVDQEDREGTADQADYTAAAGKIVLTGGPPKIHDASGNVTTGRQLTLFFRDDTINIDSAVGMRTLTLHRVEK